MVRWLTYTAYAVILLVMLVFGYLYAQAEYEALKKFYPELTFWEYMVLDRRIRITPDGE